MAFNHVFVKEDLEAEMEGDFRMGLEDDYWAALAEIKHCLTCEHNDEWMETPEGAISYEDLIPHSYCKHHKCVVDDRETCENYRRCSEQG